MKHLQRDLFSDGEQPERPTDRRKWEIRKTTGRGRRLIKLAIQITKQAEKRGRPWVTPAYLVEVARVDYGIEVSNVFREALAREVCAMCPEVEHMFNLKWSARYD